MKIKTAMMFVVAITVGLPFFTGCSSSDSDSETSTNPSESSSSYSGPGSFWTADIGASTFTMERAPNFGDDVDLTVTGSVATLDSGYKVFTVSEASGSATDLPAAGDMAYGFEVPGFFTLVKPLASSDSKLLPMLVQGSCPTTDLDFNFISTGYGGDDNLVTEADVVGVANFTNATTGFSISQQYSLDGTDVSSPGGFTGSCSNGFMQIDTNSDTVMDTDMWLSASGAAIVNTSDDNIVVAMPGESFSATTISGKEFYGLVFDENNNDNDEKVKPVWFTVASGGATAEAGEWSDIANNTKGSALAEFTFSGYGSPATGFVQATYSVDTDDNGTFDSPSANMICQFKANIASSGKDIMFCAGHPPGETDKMFNVLLVSQ